MTNSMRKSVFLAAGLAAAAMTLGSCRRFAAAVPFDKSEIQAAADEAYAYFYPLVTMDVTRAVMTNLPAGAVEGLARSMPSTIVAATRMPPRARLSVRISTRSIRWPGSICATGR